MPLPILGFGSSSGTCHLNLWLTHHTSWLSCSWLGSTRFRREHDAWASGGWLGSNDPSWVSRQRFSTQAIRGPRCLTNSDADKAIGRSRQFFKREDFMKLTRRMTLAAFAGMLALGTA
ncbi:hypothetical protein EN918_17565, partial [Mesorhizobium sp. M7A.F.Ca.CA.004.05.1.1]